MMWLILKAIFAALIGVGWIYFSGDGSHEAANVGLIIAIFVFVVLLIKPKKFETIKDNEDYKQKVLNKQMRKVQLEEERLIEKSQAEKNKAEKAQKNKKEEKE